MLNNDSFFAPIASFVQAKTMYNITDENSFDVLRTLVLTKGITKNAAVPMEFHLVQEVPVRTGPNNST